MRTADKFVSPALFLLLAAMQVGAQAVSHGVLEQDVLLTIDSLPTGDTISGDLVYHVQNLYSSPLVAISLKKTCGPKRWGIVSIDAAGEHASTVAPGKTQLLGGDKPECAVRLYAALFADGRQDGEDEAIQWFLTRRAYDLAELQPFLVLARLKLAAEFQHEGVFDPAEIEKAIVARQAALVKPTDTQASTKPNKEDPDKLDRDFNRYIEGQSVLSNLLKITQRLEGLQKEPDYDNLKRVYVRSLEEWSKALQSPTYPIHPLGLRAPR